MNNNNYIGADNSSQISSTSFRSATLDRLDLTDIICTYTLARSLCSLTGLVRFQLTLPLAIIIARLRLAFFFLASLEYNISILRLSSRLIDSFHTRRIAKIFFNIHCFVQRINVRKRVKIIPRFTKISQISSQNSSQNRRFL